MKNFVKLFIYTILITVVFFSCKDDDITEAELQVVTQEFSNIASNSAVGSAYITINSTGKTGEKGFCWSETPNPTIEDNKKPSVSEEALGSFIVQLSGLKSSTKYYSRAYAYEGEKVHYGNELSFVTNPMPEGGWCVIDKVSDITPTSALIVMEIADKGGKEIQEYGFCMSKVNDNPTVEDQKETSSVTEGMRYSTTIFDLSQNSVYYVRPYFIVKGSGEIIYGETANFRTMNFVSTSSPLSGYQAAYLFGNVVMDAGSPTSDKGVCWGTMEMPTLETGEHKSAGKGTGSYFLLVGGLTKNTTYYVRSYAQNDDGVYYGESIQFKTKNGDIFPGGNLSDMILVENGTFNMGEPNTATISSAVHANEFGLEPIHAVTISKDFYIDRFEITNEQMCTFLNVYQNNARRDGAKRALYNSSGRTYAFNVSGSFPNAVYTPVSGCARKPVANITWSTAYIYCQWLSAELNVDVRLPSEAEWEYAAKGGNKTQGFFYSGSDNKAAVAVEQSSAGPAIVGSKAPNELGIYDMSGNVFEYCADHYVKNYYLGMVGVITIDPLSTGASDAAKIIRGGSFRHATYFRTSARGQASNEGDCGNHSGMRIVMNKLPDSF